MAAGNGGATLKMRDLPPAERPREKLYFSGPAALSAEELLAVVLGSGGRGQSVLALARDLLGAIGGLPGLIDVDVHELCQLRGVGMSLACRLIAALALGRRALERPLSGRRRLSTPRQVYQHLMRRTRGLPKEIFIAIYVDGRNRCLREEVVSEGTLDASLVHPREVFRPAIKASASGVIVAHNHPSGDPTPSPEDFEVSERLLHCGRLLGIRFIDHVIVGWRRFVSFREQGLLDGIGAARESVFDAVATHRPRGGAP